MCPGDVVRLRHTFPRDLRSRTKFFVVAAILEREGLCLTINSSISKYITRLDGLLETCNLQIPAGAQHPFLEHDSVLHCYTVHRMPFIRLEAAHVGRVDPHLHSDLLRLVELSDNIAPIDKQLIRESLLP